jgi:hypothetical protein
VITETTRRCSACNGLLEATDAACPKCGRVQAPPLAEWGPHAKRLLFLVLLTDMLAVQLDNGRSEQQLYEWLLENAMRGRWYPGGRMVRHSASAAECIPEFRRLYTRWEAAGSPTDFAAVARLRRER